MLINPMKAYFDFVLKDSSLVTVPLTELCLFMEDCGALTLEFTKIPSKESTLCSIQDPKLFTDYARDFSRLPYYAQAHYSLLAARLLTSLDKGKVLTRTERPKPTNGLRECSASLRLNLLAFLRLFPSK